MVSVVAVLCNQSVPKFMLIRVEQPYVLGPANAPTAHEFLETIPAFETTQKRQAISCSHR